jgi:hypothetical protein
VTSSVWQIKATNSLTTHSQGMKQGASCTIHKENSNLLNGNHPHHHLEVKTFKSTKVKKRLCWKFSFDCQANVHYECVHEAATREMHLDILSCLRDVVRWKCPKKWKTKSWFLLYDIAPGHLSVLVKDFLTKNNVKTLEQPPQSPDMSPAEFYLFL